MRVFIRSASLVALAVVGVVSFNTNSYLGEPSLYFKPGGQPSAEPTGQGAGALKFINNSDKPVEICKLANFGIVSDRGGVSFLYFQQDAPASTAFTQKKARDQIINLSTFCLQKNIRIMQPHEIITLDKVKFGIWQDATAPIETYVISELIIPHMQLELGYGRDVRNLLISIIKSLNKSDKIIDVATMKIISLPEAPTANPVSAKIKVQTPDEYKKEVSQMTNVQLMKSITGYIDELAETAKCIPMLYQPTKPDIGPDIASLRSSEYIKPRLDIITTEIAKRLGQ